MSTGSMECIAIDLESTGATNNKVDGNYSPFQLMPNPIWKHSSPGNDRYIFRYDFLIGGTKPWIQDITYWPKDHQCHGGCMFLMNEGGYHLYLQNHFANVNWGPFTGQRNFNTWPLCMCQYPDWTQCKEATNWKCKNSAVNGYYPPVTGSIKNYKKEHDKCDFNQTIPF